MVNLIERLDPERFEHVVCAIRHLGPNADRLPKDRVRVMCLDMKSDGFPLHLGALVRAIREAQPDIVHGRNWGAVEAVVAGRLAGIPRAWCIANTVWRADANAKEPWRRRRVSTTRVRVGASGGFGFVSTREICTRGAPVLRPIGFP